MHYVYFVQSEPESRYVKVGKTKALADRWNVFCTNQPSPQLLALIECENEQTALLLEQDILNTFSDAHFRGEWLLHTSEIIEYYETYVNVDVDQVLSQAILDMKERDRELHNKRMEDPEYRECYQKKEREKSLKKNRKRSLDPGYRIRRRERQNKRYAEDPEYRENILERQRNRYADDPEVRKKKLEKSRRHYCEKKGVSSR